MFFYVDTRGLDTIMVKKVVDNIIKVKDKDSIFIVNFFVISINLISHGCEYLNILFLPTSD